VIHWWSDLDEDTPWALYVLAVPALILLHPPVYCVSTAYYLSCRTGFGEFLDYAASCEGLRRRERPDEQAAA
jgi:hypothetical protein